MIKGFNSRYTLLDLISGKEKDYHVSDMKPFIFDSALVDPLYERIDPLYERIDPLFLPVLYENVLLVDCARVNILGWNNYPSNLVGGYHEGSNEIMLALYKLNEVLFNVS